jgi:hypothetical protein
MMIRQKKIRLTLVLELRGLSFFPQVEGFSLTGILEAKDQTQ